MTQQEVKDLLRKSEYDFLREHKYLGNNIILLALGGSRAYGTNLPESDIDIRGFAVNPSNQIYGLVKDFEQVVDVATDTTIYSLNKMIVLLTSCNPNTIEILGCRPEDYLYIHEFGKLVLDNKKNFLSKRAIDTFGGYANAQYNRLEHALLGNGQNDEKTLDMLIHSLQCCLNAFNVKHQDTKSNITLKILSVDEYCQTIKQKYNNKTDELDKKLSSDIKAITSDEKLSTTDIVSKIQSVVDRYKNATDELEYLHEEELANVNTAISERIVLDGKFEQYPLGDIQTLLREFHKIKSEYGNINKRNTKKDSIHMAKHMMHLLRLYKMGIRLNTNMEIHTYWDGKDQEMLMEVRLGKYMTGDGMKVKPEFYELLKEVEDEYNYSVQHTVLPDNPNTEALNEMLFTIYSKAYRIGV